RGVSLPRSTGELTVEDRFFGCFHRRSFGGNAGIASHDGNRRVRLPFREVDLAGIGFANAERSMLPAQSWAIVFRFLVGDFRQAVGWDRGNVLCRRLKVLLAIHFFGGFRGELEYKLERA